jgi:hypothetical protein
MSLIVRVGANIQGLADGLNRGLGKVRSWVGSVNKATGGLFGSLIGAASVAGAVRAVTSLVGKMDEIAKAAGKMRVTTDEYQAMAFAANRAGVDVDVLGKATQQLTERLGDAMVKGGESARAFKLLGLNLDALAKMTAYERLNAVADALKNVKDEALKASIMKDVLGKASREIGPLLNDLSALDAEFKEMGATIENETLKAAERLADSITNLKTVAMAFVANSGLVEYLEKYASTIQDIVKLRAEMAKRQESQSEQFRDIGIAERAVIGAGRGRRGGKAEMLLEAGVEVLAGPKVEVRNDQTAEEIRTGLDRAAEQRKKRLAEQEKQAEQVRLAAIEQQRQADEDAAAERQKAADEAQKIADRQAAGIAKGIAGMERQNQLEKMKRDGLAKEAHILEELDRLEKDRALTAEETARARAAAGAAYDMRQQEESEAQMQEPTRDRPRAPDAPLAANALERMGFIFGAKVQLDPVPRQHLEVARRQERHLEKIANRTPTERQPEFV